MINLELLNESESIELELENNSNVGSEINDVQINGASIVKDGVADIPKATKDVAGVVKVETNTNRPVYIDSDGLLQIARVAGSDLDNRNQQKLISGAMYDHAVRKAMCDGKGQAWTTEEKASARERMGIDTWEEVADITLEEDVEYINIEFDKAYREIYVYVSQDNCETKLTGSKSLYPRLNLTLDNNEKFGFLSSYIALNSVYNDMILVARNHDNLWIERHVQNLNAQKNTTSDALKAKYVDTAFQEKLKDITDLNFYGVYCNCTNKGTRIRVLGVKA